MSKHKQTSESTHVLARSRDTLKELEVVVSLHAALLNSLAKHVKWRQVTRVGSVEDRHHDLKTPEQGGGRGLLTLPCTPLWHVRMY